MKTYEDKRGWRFTVMRITGGWRARYNKPHSMAWRCVHNLPIRDKAREAEADPAGYANSHKMQVVGE